MDLSVIIPCRNEANTLTQQLDALATQAWDGRWDVIVVDNGSTDLTATVASAHAGLADRIKVVAAPLAKGIAAVRRCGVDASSADAFVFCDGDDVVAPGWLAGLGNALRVHQLVTGEIDVDLLNSPELATSRGRGRTGSPPRFGESVFPRGNNCGLTRAAWERLGGFDDKFPGLEDIEMGLRAAAAGMQVEFVPSALVHYRYRTSFTKLWKQGKYYGASYPRLSRRCRELGLVAPARASALRSWVWLVLYLPRAPFAKYRYRWVWTLACRLGALRAVAGRRTKSVP